MAEKLCPDFKTPCLEHGCRAYIQILGQLPQGGELPNKGWGCGKYDWEPILIIEVAKEVRQAAAAIESARNQARNDAAALGAGLLQVAAATREASARVVRGELLEARPSGFLSRLRLAFKGG